MEAKKKAKTGKETAGKEGMRFPREVEVVNIERNNRVGARCMYGVQAKLPVHRNISFVGNKGQHWGVRRRYGSKREAKRGKGV